MKTAQMTRSAPTQNAGPQTNQNPAPAINDDPAAAERAAALAAASQTPGVTAEEAALIGKDNPDALAALSQARIDEEIAKREAEIQRIKDQQDAAAFRELQARQRAADEAAQNAVAAKGPVMYVLDLTATSETRYHDVIVDGLIKSIAFRARTPTPLPPQIAVKLLKHDTFVRTDEHGDAMPFQNAPKQPHELGAGEQFKLERDTTVANYDELHTIALRVRAMQIEGGERFVESKDRAQMIAFIIAKTEEKQKKNMGREPSLGIEEWTPPAENNDALDTGAWA